MPRPVASIALAAAVAVLVSLLAAVTPARAATPVEPYAPYQPQTRCSPAAKPGTVVLARWIVRTYGGQKGGIARACRSGGRSEHKEGRAFDWTISVSRRSDRVRAKRLLQALFATDAAGNPDALARRMGVMYVIWDDRMWSAWDGFEAKPYKSSGCRTLARCSPTLRHRDHLHISITRHAARGLYSWYERRL